MDGHAGDISRAFNKDATLVTVCMVTRSVITQESTEKSHREEVGAADQKLKRIVE